MRLDELMVKENRTRRAWDRITAVFTMLYPYIIIYTIL